MNINYNLEWYNVFKKNTNKKTVNFMNYSSNNFLTTWFLTKNLDYDFKDYINKQKINPDNSLNICPLNVHYKGRLNNKSYYDNSEFHNTWFNLNKFMFDPKYINDIDYIWLIKTKKDQDIYPLDIGGVNTYYTNNNLIHGLGNSFNKFVTPNKCETLKRHLF